MLLDAKSKKKKRSKKKGTNASASTPSTPTADTQEVADTKETPEEDDESEQEDITTPAQKEEETTVANPTADITNGVAKTSLVEEDNVDHDNGNDDGDGNGNGNEDAAARFDALVKDRDALRAEVTELRQSLEELQSKHAAEIEAIQGDLAEAQAEKESAEEQYQSLLGKVNTIRSQLGERLKADAVRIVSFRSLTLAS